MLCEGEAGVRGVAAGPEAEADRLPAEARRGPEGSSSVGSGGRGPTDPWIQELWAPER